MAQSQSPSPLSPRVANLNTPSKTQKLISRRPPEPSTFEIHSDVENHPHEDQIGTITPASKISQSPDKHKSVSRQPSPKKLDQETSREVRLTEGALRENEGLTRAIDMMNGGDSILDLYSGNDGLSVAGTAVGYPGMDDTCFSTFSAVPNTDMTLLAHAGQSPAKSLSPAKRSRELQYGSAAPTPRTTGRSTPATSRRTPFDDCSPSPTPRRPKSSRDADTTNLILDFTEQFNAFSQAVHTSPTQRTRPTMSKFNTQPDLASYTAAKRAPSPGKGMPNTPSRSHNLANLLDFDLPPAPTPRSIPTITARELESLKSSMLSQISNLRATLSGREAEVNSLKEAVTDAERRVGEAQESIRDERGQKETLQAEKDDWQARDKEMQAVLRSVKEEIIHEQHEHEKLQQRLEASEKKIVETEAKLLEADSKIAGLQAASAAGSAAVADGQSTPGGTGGNTAVEAAVEKVARELHGLYKSKHETKVAALKKSYEARWERKIKDLESRIDNLTHENDELRIGRDATLTGVAPSTLSSNKSDGAPVHENARQNTEEAATQLVEQRACLENLSQEIHTVKHENIHLLQQLEKERLEMAELVKATEEMMKLSLQPPNSSGGGDERLTSGTENLRGSITKASVGLKPPSAGSGESRIGRMGRSGSGLSSTRSGIMSNIERMGRGRVMD